MTFLFKVILAKFKNILFIGIIFRISSLKLKISIYYTTTRDELARAHH